MGKILGAIVLVAMAIWAMKVNGPPANGAELARARVEQCYSGGATGDGADCVGILAEVRDATASYGPLQNYQVASVTGGSFFDRRFEVTIDAQRGGRRTREVVSVKSGHSSHLESDYAVLEELTVTRP